MQPSTNKGCTRAHHTCNVRPAAWCKVFGEPSPTRNSRERPSIEYVECTRCCAPKEREPPGRAALVPSLLQRRWGHATLAATKSIAQPGGNHVEIHVPLAGRKRAAQNYALAVRLEVRSEVVNRDSEVSCDGVLKTATECYAVGN